MADPPGQLGFPEVLLQLDAEPSPLPFRPDIQGLRAIAIGAVVLAHAGSLLPGGFLGVDMFFVVSGFVIGRLLVAELLDTGGLDWPGFVARRARRLLPASCLMTMVTMGLVVLLVGPFGAQQEMANTALSGQLFVSNFQLYRHVGYLDGWVPGTTLNPFMHLWSLSVEEQFYLLLPLVLLGLWPFARASARPRLLLGVVVAAGAALSFVLALGLTSGWWELGFAAPERFAFYSPVTRAWQLGVGVLVAMWGSGVVRERSRATWSVLSGIALFVLVAAFIEVDPRMAQPGLAAAAVVAATAVLLAVSPVSPIGHALSHPVLLAVGSVSYAWYLWHWPAIVVATLVWPGNDLAVWAAVLVSLVVAGGSTRWIESPIRRANWSNRRTAVICFAMVVVTMAVIGGARVGMAHRWGMGLPPAEEPVVVGRDVCHIVNVDGVDEWDAGLCVTGPDQAAIRIAVVGDGAAESLAPLVRSIGEERGAAVWWKSRTGCPFLVRAPAYEPKCEQWQEETWRELGRFAPDVVILANQSSDVVGPLDRFAPILDEPGGPRIENVSVGSSDVVADTVRRIGEMGATTVLTGSIPDDGSLFVERSLIRPAIVPGAPDGPTASSMQADGRAADLRASERSGAAFVDLFSELCPRSTCPAEGADGRDWYRAPGQLTVAGALRLRGSLDTAIGRAISRQSDDGGG